MSSSSKKTFYDILEVKEDCTAQEIKNAFITLSKKYHPDKTTNKSDHAVFVKINEAYSVLSKQSTRTLYDYDRNATKDGRVYRHYYGDVYTTRNDPSFWANRAKGFSGDAPYYSIKGLKKVPNSVIVSICFAFAVIGAGIEYLAFSSTLGYDKAKLQHDSARNHILWELAREEAHKNGNEEQLKKFMEGQLKSKNIQQANILYARRLLDQEADISNK